MCMMVTVCLTLVAAVIFGAASVLEQHSTKQVPDRAALSPRLIIDLLKRPQFLAALTLTVVGSALQILALHAGSPALVQPLLVLSLLFAVVIAAATRRRPPDRVVLGGAITCIAGIACFLAVARPHGGSSDVSSVAWLPLATALAAVLAGCLAAVRWGPAGIRSLWLALACGVDFGVNAFLLKVVPDTLPLGFADPVRQWPLFMIVIVTPAGFLLNQNAFQAGTLISPVLALIYTADPLTSITVSIMFLHERIAASPPALAGEAAALAVMTSGIIALAHRAPTCAGRLPLQPRPGPATTPEVPAAHTHRGTNPEPRSAPDAQSAPAGLVQQLLEGCLSRLRGLVAADRPAPGRVATARRGQRHHQHTAAEDDRDHLLPGFLAEAHRHQPECRARHRRHRLVPAMESPLRRDPRPCRGPDRPDPAHARVLRRDHPHPPRPHPQLRPRRPPARQLRAANFRSAAFLL
jgi:drug/metabolite transporter (DMT)-like permease